MRVGIRGEGRREERERQGRIGEGSGKGRMMGYARDRQEKGTIEV